jgi:hypothetical protein
VSEAETVEREDRDRRWAVPAAVAGGILPLAAGFVAVGVAGKNYSNTPAQLLYLDDKATTLTVTAVFGAIGLAVTGPALLYLFFAARARRPQIPRPFGVLAIVGAVLAALGHIGNQIALSVIAGRFASEDGQGYQHAIDLLNVPGRAIAGIGGLFGSFVLGAALVVISLNAMRVGLLSRLMGYIGIFAGVFTVIPLVPVPIVLSFWLVALGALFAGIWPGGRPPAWASGQAEPWPAGGAWRERAAGGGAGARAGPGAGAGAGGTASPAERSARNDPPPAAPLPPARPGDARRKRKKRR